MAKVWRIFAATVLMGAANVVPGVSAGTVAFSLGIYDRLITGAAALRLSLFTLLFRGRFRECTRRFDLGFLALVGFGFGIGIIGFSHLIHRLLAWGPGHICLYAAFCGLILIALVGCVRRVERWTLLRVSALMTAALVVGGVLLFVQPLVPSATAVSLPHIVIGGIVSAFALLLPGLSGALVLQVLGLYGPTLEHLVAFTSGAMGSLAYLATLGVSILVGVLLSVRLIAFLLGRYRSMTVALLTGCIVGTLPAMWPFRGVEMAVTPVLYGAALLAALGGASLGLLTLRIKPASNE